MHLFKIFTLKLEESVIALGNTFTGNNQKLC